MIALGYALAVVGGVAVVALNELRMSEDIAQGSPGHGRFCRRHTVHASEGVLQPPADVVPAETDRSEGATHSARFPALSRGYWTIDLAGDDPIRRRYGRITRVNTVSGALIALGAISRIVAGPVVMTVEGITILLARGSIMRALLAGAILMDLIPLVMSALHMARAIV